jgi:hypothetical protein
MSDETEAIPTTPDLRDYFAGCAMNALMANSDLMRTTLETAQSKGLASSDVTARLAYAYADAMLGARKVKP